MRVHALDHARVQPHPGREREVTAVQDAEVDRARLPAVGEAEQILGCVHDVVRDPELLRPDVVRAARERGQRRLGAGEPVGRLVDRAVARVHGDDVESLRRRVAAQVQGVPAMLGLLDVHVVAALQRVDHEVA
jgi:hypothetical protein